MRATYCLATLAAAVVVVTGCVGPVPCKSDQDCGGNGTCLPIQVCTLKCTTDADCPGGQTCGHNGGCIPKGGCGADTDCGQDQVCSALACIQSCKVAACSAGYTCRADGHCVQDNGPNSCGGQLFDATRVQANVLIVLDRSGSMMDPVGGVPKWQTASAAVKQVTDKYGMGGQIRFGLELFPGLAGSQKCIPGSVQVPVSDTSLAAIQSALPATAAGNSTPIAASLNVAAQQTQLDDPTRANYVLLVTDGQENCSGDPVAPVKQMFTRGIKTYVVGFGSEVDRTRLSNMAKEGGTARATSPAYYQADDVATFMQAFDSVAKGAIGCDFKLAQVPPDPTKLYLYINGQPAPRDPTRTNGWEYTAATNRITLYGPTCDSVSGGAHLNIVYGCPDTTLIEGPPSGDGGFGPDDGGIIIN